MVVTNRMACNQCLRLPLSVHCKEFLGGAPLRINWHLIISANKNPQPAQIAFTKISDLNWLRLQTL